MAYTALNKARPDPALNTPQMANDARTNIQAMRDALVACGVVQGFNYSFSGGTADQPTNMLYTRTEGGITEIVKVVLTWDANGNATKAAYYYSANNGSTYDAMVDSNGNYVINFTIDASFNVTSTTWNATP